MSIEAVRTVFARRREAWLAADAEAYLDCWVEDLVLETPGRTVRGRAAYEKMVNQSFAWAEPKSLTFNHIAIDTETADRVDGEIVLADWSIEVARRSDGLVIAWDGMSVAELYDDKIVWWREFFADPAELARVARSDPRSNR